MATSTRAPGAAKGHTTLRGHAATGVKTNSDWRGTVASIRTTRIVEGSVLVATWLTWLLAMTLLAGCGDDPTGSTRVTCIDQPTGSAVASTCEED
jgi:hypothetical protein